MSIKFQRAADIVARGQREGAYPAAVVEVGKAAGVLWRQAFGRLDGEPESAATRDDTIFDLASLTKVLATTTLAMHFVDAGRIALSDPIARWIPEWRGHDR